MPLEIFACGRDDPCWSPRAEGIRRQIIARRPDCCVRPFTRHAQRPGRTSRHDYQPAQWFDWRVQTAERQLRAISTVGATALSQRQLGTVRTTPAEMCTRAARARPSKLKRALTAEIDPRDFLTGPISRARDRGACPCYPGVTQPDVA